MGLFLHRLAAAMVLAFEVFACLASVALMAALAAGPLYAGALPIQPLPWQWAAAFVAASVLAVAASWVKGIFDKRLPARIGGEPRHAHISGWTFIWIVLVMSVIVALATWAAESDDNKAIISTDWGEAIMLALAVAFVTAALIPTMSLADRAAGAIAYIGRLIRPFGRLLSIVDSILVFAVAGAAGATQRSVFVRYVMLFGTLGACAAMGYWLQPPWGLVPLAWGFLVSVAISRRWAWIETDRELAMLNRRFVGSHLRIGFQHDLRDEALLSFASLLILVPLALRQAQLTALGAGFELFNTDLAEAQNLRTWIAFFGAELAKAVPFVDWAEVYDVGGADDSLVRSAISQHFVFATRILVDLVFLAALLQALSISARNATQRGLFYEGQLDRLDPFLEPREFRKLLRRGETGKLEPDPERVSAFPAYDPIRLSELAGDDNRGLWLRTAVNAVRAHQGGSNIDEFHAELARRLRAPERDKGAILQVINAVRAAGPSRDIVLLDQLRRELNFAPRLIDVRTQLVRLLAEAPDSAERTVALVGALDHDRDSLGPVRLVALAGLGDAAQRGDREAGIALQRMLQSKSLTPAEKRSVRDIITRVDRGEPLRRRRDAAPAPPPARPQAPPPPPAAAPLAAPAIEDAVYEDENQEGDRDEDGDDTPDALAAAPETEEAPGDASEDAPEQVGEPPRGYARAADGPPQPAQRAPSGKPKRRSSDIPGWIALGAFAIAGAAAIYVWQHPDIFSRSASEQTRAVAAIPAGPEATPARAFRDCPSCPEMMRLDGGGYQMGAAPGEAGRRPWEAPQHEVDVPAFAIGVREVSFDEWAACVADGGCARYNPPDRGWGAGARPVIMVSWSDAQTYLRWLNEKTGRAYRLPSEAEWEYAARAGTYTRYWWGDDFDQARVASGRTIEATAGAGNGFGLLHVTGNVAEWVQDCYVNNYGSVPVDGAPMLVGDCEQRVVRGGSWRDGAGALRIAGRSRVTRTTRDATIGFRVAAPAD